MLTKKRFLDTSRFGTAECELSEVEQFLIYCFNDFDEFVMAKVSAIMCQHRFEGDEYVGLSIVGNVGTGSLRILEGKKD